MLYSRKFTSYAGLTRWFNNSKQELIIVSINSCSNNDQILYYKIAEEVKNKKLV